MWPRVTGRRVARVVAMSGLVLAGCWKDNPAFIATEGTTTAGDAGGSTEVATVEPFSETSTTTTTDGATTAVSPTEAAPSTGVATSGPDTTTTTTDATSSTGTTGDPAPACGASGYGPAELLARQWYGPIPEACNDIAGRNYSVIGIDREQVLAVGCTTDPQAGCVGCDPALTLTFGFSAPQPDLLLDVAPCVYLSAHGATEVDPLGPCRFQQMALWWNQTTVPANDPPIAIFGHDTLAVDPGVAEVFGAAPQVEALLLDGECGCVDANDCCADKAADYALRFTADDEVKLEPGTHASLTVGGAVYDVYNGQSFETGACAQEQRFDWWLVRF